MKRTVPLILLITIYYVLYTIYCFADTIYTKDNKELKGIVVEDYKDRVKFSTIDGEINVMKSDVRELYYDTEEQNLIKLAEHSRDKGDYIKAFVYYDKAFKLNPDSAQAKDGIVFLQGYLFKKDMAQKEEAVRRHNEFEQRGEKAEIKSDEETFNDTLKKLRASAGVTLRTVGGVTEIENVSIGSPAYAAGIRSGDILIAVWGRLVGYMSFKEVVETLLEKTSLETKCTIERNIKVSLTGVTLSMQSDGLTISEIKDDSPAQAAGLKQNDIIVYINANPTRYMPLKRAIEIIKKSKGDAVNLTIRREAIMWGKGGE